MFSDLVSCQHYDAACAHVVTVSMVKVHFCAIPGKALSFICMEFPVNGRFFPVNGPRAADSPV